MIKKATLLSLFAVSMMTFAVSAEAEDRGHHQEKHDKKDECCQKVERLTKQVECHVDKAGHELEQLLCWLRENVNCDISRELKNTHQDACSVKRLVEAVISLLQEKIPCDPCCKLEHLEKSLKCLERHVGCILALIQDWN